MRFVPLVVAGMLLQSCAYHGSVADRSQAFNDDIAEANDSVLLSNILRAARREPLHFTVVSSANAGSQVSGEISTALPLQAFGSANTFGPSLTISDPRPTLTLTPEIAKGFATGVARRIDPKTLALFVAQGIPKELIFMLLIERIEIKRLVKPADGERNFTLTIVCKNSPRLEPMSLHEDCFSGKVSFERLLRMLLDNGLTVETLSNTSSINLPLTQTQAARYLSGEAKFGGVISAIPGTKNFRVSTTSERTSFSLDKVVNKRPLQEALLSLIGEEHADEFLRFQALLDAKNEDESKTDFEAGDYSVQIKVRSTIGVFNYLGEIVAEQTRVGDDEFRLAGRINRTPVIYPNDGRPQPSCGQFQGTQLRDGDFNLSALQCSDDLNDEDLMNRQKINNTDDPFKQPHSLFVVCRQPADSAKPGNVLVQTVRNGVRFYVPVDVGSKSEPVCGYDNVLIKDQRAGQTLSVLSQLLQLNRDATELTDRGAITLID